MNVGVSAVDEMLARVERAFAEGQYEATLDSCSEILAVEPENPDAHRWIARTAVKLGADPIAERHLRRAIAGRPDDPRMVLDLSDLLLRGNRLSEAERTLLRATTAFPEDATLYAQLGRVRHKAMRFEAAAEALAHAAELAPTDADIAFWWGRALAEIGTRHAEATRVQRQAAELSRFHPDKVWPAVNWHLINDELEIAADYVRALIALRTEHDPDPAPQFTLGRIFVALGRAEEAERELALALDKCGRLTPESGRSAADIAAYAARVHYIRGARDEAAALLRANGEGVTADRFTYDPAVYPTDMPARLARLRSIVRGRDIAVLCHGPSIAALEPLAEKLQDADVCYVSVNRFLTVENHILDRIGKRLDIVIETSPGEVAGYAPHIEQYLARPDGNALIASRAALALLPDSAGFESRFDPKLLFFEMRTGRLATSEHPLHFIPGNTLSVLLPLLHLSLPRRIFLFGADGGAPSQGATHYRMDSPEFTSGGEVDRASLRSRLLQDTRQFNDIADLQTLCLTGLFRVPPAPVLNCSLTSLYAPYPLLSVEEGVALLAR